MFDIDRGRLLELFNQFKCGVTVENIIKRELFTLELIRVADTGLIDYRILVESCFLVGILTVTQILGFSPLPGVGFREKLLACRGGIRNREKSQVIGDRGIVGSG